MKDNIGLNLLLFLTFVLIFGVVYSIGNRIYHHDDLMLIKENHLGCKKYRQYGDEWWVCPKGLNISSFEERINKHTVSIPVVEQ